MVSRDLLLYKQCHTCLATSYDCVHLSTEHIEIESFHNFNLNIS